MSFTPRLVSAFQRWHRIAAAIAFGCIVCGSWSHAAPVAQTPVPEAELTSAPNKFVGYVRTGFDAPDPAYRGSGFVVGGRVVLTAAHVFYNPDRPGWNRATWYWQSAPKPATFDDYARMIAPRTYRVLAGYAAAVQRVTDDKSQLDAFNQDTLALLFYQRVDENGVSSIAYDSVAGSGTFSLVGYPAEIGGTTTSWGQMYGHGAGVAATFTRENPANDYLGNPMVLFETADLLSGGGQSGGPLFRRIDGEWKAVGVTVARSYDYSTLVVRGLDSAAQALIAASNADTQSGQVGEIDHGWAETAVQAPPVLRADGSLVAVTYTGTTSAIRAFDRNGKELWRREEQYFLPTQMAETPDGRIVCQATGQVIAYEGATGKKLWEYHGPVSLPSMAVGSRGELYLASDHVDVISPAGSLETNLTDPAFTIFNAPSAIGPDNTCYLIGGDNLIALSPAMKKLWQVPVKSDSGQSIGVSSLAISSDGRIYLRTSIDLRAYDSTGKLLWKIADPVETIVDRTINILPDGRLLTLRTGAAVFLSADGVEQRRVTLDTRVNSIAIDADETLYASDGTSVKAISDQPGRSWTNTRTGGLLYLGAGNQLCVRDTTKRQLNVILANAGAAPGLWQAEGGPDHGRRVAYTTAIAPRILASPVAAAVAEGYRLELNALADGSFPLTFEWRHDGKIVPDAFGAQLVIPFAAASDAGSYTVTVRNRAGSVMSAAAAVTVTVAKFGDVVWSTNLQAAGTPAVAPDGTTYVPFFSKQSNGLGNSTMSLAAIDKGGNELWRVEIGPVAWAAYDPHAPIVGDDGTIFVSADARIVAVSPAGVVRWAKNVENGYSEPPRLALGSGGELYAMYETTPSLIVARFRADGSTEWAVDVKPFGAEFGQPRVRRDGNVVVPAVVLVSPSGAVTALKKQRNNGVSLIGPNDEIVSYVPSDGYAPPAMEIFDRAGQLALRTAQAQMGDPRILTRTGNLVDAAGTSLPFGGNGTTMLGHTVNFTRTVLADLGQDRLLSIESDGRLQVWDHAATVTTSAQLEPSSGTNFVLSNSGVLIGGYTVKAYRVGTGPASSPWPLRGADARQTWRAPSAFQWSVSPPRSTAIAADGALTIGYAATLHVDVDGVGPFSFQWQRDGVDLTGETKQSLTFANPSADNSGRYRVIVTNASGTVYSSEFVAQFAAPSAAPPGFYAGHVRNVGSGQVTASYAALIQADRTIEFFLIDELNGAGNASGSRLTADGSFPSGLNMGAPTFRFADGRINFGSDATVEPVDVSATVAANGMPVGFYRGGAADGVGQRAYGAVLPDGKVWWVYDLSNDYGWSGELSLPSGSLTAPGSVRESFGPMDYQLTGTSDGVLRLSRTNVDAFPTMSLPAFGMVWSGRSKTERLVNISTRAWISPAWPPLIAGFVMNGQRQLLVRGIGPTLAQLGLPAASILAHPQLHLSSSTGATLAVATRWADAADRADLRATAKRVGAFALVESSEDAALLRTFTDPLYTTLLDGADGGAGIALIEVYDADASLPGSLVNLSSRGYAGNGDNVLIAGFVISGSAPKTLLIRGIGPGLAPLIGQANFPLVALPRLRVFGSTGKEIARNEMWRGGAQSYIAAVTKQVGAFTPDTFDSAMLITLEPGVYTAIVDANGGLPGVALLELYDVP